MNEVGEIRIQLRIYAFLWQRAIIYGAARQAGMSPGAWMFRAISNQLVSEGKPPLGEYPAETHGGRRRGKHIEGG